MRLRITDMNKSGKAFLVDEETGKSYYTDSREPSIRETEQMDYHPMNTPGIVDKTTGKEIFWLDCKTFSPITFGSLEVAKFYIEHRSKEESREQVDSLSR